MNLPEESQLQEKLKNVEPQVYQTSPLVEESKPGWIEIVQTLQNTLNKLSLFWKVVLIVGAVVFFFAILNIFFKLVSALISLFILLAVIYVGYRLIIFSAASKSSKE